tara:strand:+ start:157 stop:696 length:540 start_codon:yes stop_codon:yes gene_type:complete
MQKDNLAGLVSSIYTAHFLDTRFQYQRYDDLRNRRGAFQLRMQLVPTFNGDGYDLIFSPALKMGPAGGMAQDDPNVYDGIDISGERRSKVPDCFNLLRYEVREVPGEDDANILEVTGPSFNDVNKSKYRSVLTVLETMHLLLDRVGLKVEEEKDDGAISVYRMPINKDLTLKLSRRPDS